MLAACKYLHVPGKKYPTGVYNSLFIIIFLKYLRTANSYFSDKNFAFFDFLGFQKKKNIFRYKFNLDLDYFMTGQQLNIYETQNPG